MNTVAKTSRSVSGAHRLHILPKSGRMSLCGGAELETDDTSDNERLVDF